MFNNEFKPTWDELAPSLQYLLKSLQSQIVGNYNTIEDYLNKIKDLEDKIKELENANQFENLYANGSTGQVVKVNRVERKLYPDDEFHIRLVSDVDSEIKKYIAKNMNQYITEHINVIGYGIKEVNFNSANNGYVLFTNGFLINVIAAPNSMGEHDWLTIKFVKPFSTILFCGGLNNTLNLGGDGDNKDGATVRSFDKNGATFVGSENSSGTPMAIAMGWA